MSDVREQLRVYLHKEFGWFDAGNITDLLLERFDVVEKPVVTDRELGSMVMSAYERRYYGDQGMLDQRGELMRTKLEAAGLRIVKVDAK